MDQWLSNLSPFETYLIAVPAIMLDSILFLGGIILLLGRRNKNDAETLEAIRKDLEKAGTEGGVRERYTMPMHTGGGSARGETHESENAHNRNLLIRNTFDWLRSI